MIVKSCQLLVKSCQFFFNLVKLLLYLVKLLLNLVEYVQLEGDIDPATWLLQVLPLGAIVGADPRLVSSGERDGYNE